MPILRVALVQVTSAGTDQDENLARGLTACETAAAAGADVVVFPEMWQIGYAACPQDPERRRAWQDMAISADSPWLEAFRRAAGELRMAIVATFLERWPGAPRNAAVLIDHKGRHVCTYAKVHTCDFGMEAALTPGDGFEVVPLETAHGVVPVGIMICYDREFPESARVLMLAGAEVILTPNACDLNDDRVGQFRARAFENMIAVTMANYPAPQCNGRSCAFDGVAFRPDGSSRDHKLVEAGTDPGIVLADIDLDLLRRYRREETWGDAYRKPYAYETLVDDHSRVPSCVLTQDEQAPQPSESRRTRR